MGLMDRDYMHERHRAARKGTHRHPKKDGITWSAIGWTMAVCATVFVVVKYGVLAASAQPFPPSGAVLWYVAVNDGQTAPLTITAPPTGDGLHAVRVDLAEGGPTIALIPLRRGERVKVEIPLGRYEMTFASGERWLGPEDLFGMTGEKRKANKIFHFYRSGNQTMGHQIDLTKRLDGNLTTRPSTFLDR